MTTKTQTHTPTPWKQDNGSSISASGGFSESWNKQIPSTEHRTVIATINGNLENWDSNAAFIVRAVNAHEELIKAISDALYLLENGSKVGEHREAKQALREAIAKAEGGAQ